MTDKPKRGRPKSPDTDPVTGRRGRVLAVQMDEPLRALVEWEFEAMRALGVPVNRSDVARAMLLRGAATLPEIVETRLRGEGFEELLARRMSLLAGATSPDRDKHGSG